MNPSKAKGIAELQKRRAYNSPSTATAEFCRLSAAISQSFSSYQHKPEINNRRKYLKKYKMQEYRSYVMAIRYNLERGATFGFNHGQNCNTDVKPYYHTL